MKHKRIISRRAEKEMKKDRKMHPKKDTVPILMQYPKSRKSIQREILERKTSLKNTVL